MRLINGSPQIALFLAALIASISVAAPRAHAAEASANIPSDVEQQRASSNGDGKERNFYEVLEDVLSDFEFDLKNGNVAGLKQLAIRNIAVSENIPASFKSHLELLVTEKILRTTKTKMVQCLPCRAKRTTVQGDQVVVTSPETNPAELARIAKNAGIENFLDLAFAYQPTGMILSMRITEPETESIVWSRTYNSETSRASAFRRGVDYSQVDDARKTTEYTPTVQYRATAYYLFEPNVNGTTGCLGLGFRMVERYDNRKKEVGFEFDYLRDSSSLTNSAAGAGSVDLYTGFNLTLLFVHGWNFIGEEENYNKVRANLTLGVGGTYSSGYLGGLVRAQWEWRLGKNYAVTATGGYRPTSTAFLGGTAAGAVSGVEFGIGISRMF